MFSGKIMEKYNRKILLKIIFSSQLFKPKRSNTDGHRLLDADDAIINGIIL